jgi:diguanylate cyclase (GGDEF)-like protein
VSGRPAALVALLTFLTLTPAGALGQLAAPIVPPGTRLGDAAPASLVQPSTFQATFRVPPLTDLAVATSWLTRTLTVTLTYPGGRSVTVVGAPTLPGATLGVQLPDDAWRATRIDLAGTTVSEAGIPLLVTGAQLAYAGASDWWHIAAFGLFLGVTLLGALLAIWRRTRALTALAVLAGAQTVLAIPYLGVLRPAPEISQPVHALALALAWSALAALVVDRAAAARPPRVARVVLLTLLGVNVIFQLGTDVFQDRWMIVDPALTDTLGRALLAAFDLALVALAVLALLAGVAGARLLLVATAALALGALLGFAVNPYATQTAMSAGTIVALLALALLLVGDPLSTTAPAAPPIDGLTGLANRPAFEAALHAAWTRARADGTPVALLLLNLDHFKRYNEAYGHLEGDEALRRCGEAFATACAGAPGALVARYRRDELAALLPGCGPAGALALAIGAHEAVGALEILHAEMPLRRLSASVGAAALAPDAVTSPDALVRRADAALFVAKTMGRNRVVLDEPPAQEPTKTESGSSPLSA